MTRDGNSPRCPDCNFSTLAIRAKANTSITVETYGFDSLGNPNTSFGGAELSAFFTVEKL